MMRLILIIFLPVVQKPNSKSIIRGVRRKRERLPSIQTSLSEVTRRSTSRHARQLRRRVTPDSVLAFLGSITGLPNVGDGTTISPNGVQLWKMAKMHAALPPMITSAAESAQACPKLLLAPSGCPTIRSSDPLAFP
jgi:hypothetical protein